MTRGHYKGDLALVREVRDSGLKCIIQCVPRIDLTLADLTPEEARIRRRTVRPPQKFFNAQEIAAMGRHSMTRQRFPGMGSGFVCDFFEGNYYHDGYLIKEVSVGKMVIPCGSENPPTLDELQRFRNRNKGGEDNGDGDENQGSKVAKSLLDELSELTRFGAQNSTGNENGLIIGDTVEVVYGDLVGMIGKILSIDGSTVKLKPTNAADLGDMTEIAFLINQVKKHISVGAHVKIIDGRYINETGVVVALELLEGDTDSTAVVLTDMSHKEISGMFILSSPSSVSTQG
jgi:transcription elongation factor SPT5